MSRLVLLTLLAALAVAPAAQAQTSTNEFAQTGRFGLGLGGGTLTSGASGKLYLNDAMAVQATLGLWAGFGLSGNVDAIFEMPSIFSNEHLNLNWNVGAGAALGFFTNTAVVGAAGVAGLSLQLKQFPLELTSELRPTLLFGNFVGGFYFGGGGAIRYFF